MRAVDKVKSTVLNASASSVGTMLTLIAFSLIMLVVGAPTNDYQVCNQLVIIAAICSYAGMLYHAFKLTDSISFYLLVLLVSFPFYFGKQLLVAFGLKPARIYIVCCANRFIHLGIQFFHPSVTLDFAARLLFVCQAAFSRLEGAGGASEMFKVVLCASQGKCVSYNRSCDTHTFLSI